MKFTHDEPQRTSTKYTHTNIFNITDPENMQKVSFKLSHVKLAHMNIGSHLNSMYLYVYLYKNKHAKPLKLIADVERYISAISDVPLRPILLASESSPNLPPKLAIQLPYKRINNNIEFQFHVYNSANNRIKVEDLQPGSELSMYIELNTVWNNDTERGVNWSMLQCKQYDNFDYSKCAFLDEEPVTPPPQTECFHCTYCPRTVMHTISTLPPPPPPPLPPPPVIAKPSAHVVSERFTPSLDDILAIRKKLRKPVAKETSRRK